MTYRVILFLLFITAFSYQVSAQQSYTPTIVNPLSETWRWKYFPKLEGKGVRHITEDDKGTVWVGVDDGVFEYNGYRWRFHQNGTNGLSDAPIIQVVITKEGKLFAVSPRKIFTYDGIRWKALFETPQNYEFAFTKMILLEDESLMLSSEKGLLHFQEDGNHIFHTTENQITAFEAANIHYRWKAFPASILKEGTFTNISDIIQDRRGMIWLAFSDDLNDQGQLIRFRPSSSADCDISQYQNYVSNEDLKFGEESKMIETKNGAIWVINTSFKAPINVFSNDQWTSIWLSEEFGGDEYTSDIVQTSDGTVWVGSLGKLYGYKNNQWTLYESPGYTVPSNKLHLFEGKSNKLWIAGWLSKAYLLDYSSQRWLTYKNLNFQSQGSNQVQWFMDIEGRVIKKEGNQWKAWSTKDGLIDAPVRLITTKKGQVWVAGSHEGVAATAYLDEQTWRRQTHPKLSWGIDYRSVFEANNGSLWFGGSVDIERDKGQLSGVIQLQNPLADTLQWRHFKAFELGYDQTNSYGFAESPDGRIWTGGSSLLFFNGEEWSTTPLNKLSNYVNCLSSTDDLLLVGSRYYGLFVYDGQEWKNFSTESGLSNNNIISINAIANDNIWVATESGISHFDGIQWQNNVFPEQMNMEIEGGDLSNCASGAVWINHSERSWKRRAFRYYKHQNTRNETFATFRYVPDVIPPETTINFFSENVSPSGNTFIQWEGEDFFEETPTDQLTYSFRLNDDEWSAFSPEKQHTFLSLKNGTYELQVRAKDLASNIDPVPASIFFKVPPPIWKQLWFILLILSFVSTISIFGYNIYTKNKKLERLNNSLQNANQQLQESGQKISLQNKEILKQQAVILEQKKSLEDSNLNLEQQNREIQLQRDKVEELSKAKLGFFTNISHELRTPLSLILGPIYQLKESQDLDDGGEHKLYDIIERNAKRLLKLINQLLEIRRIENSSMSLELRSVHLNLFVEKLIELFQNLSTKKNVQLHFQSTLEDKTFEIDPDKIEKIIVNLVSNAFKYTPELGEITVALSKVNNADHKLPEQYDHYVLLQVTDTGGGISVEEMEHIFERYYHKKNPDKTQESTGIGLSYIKDLVKTHGGVVRVQSELGLGSEFSIYIPMEQENDSVQSPLLPELDYEYAQQEIESVLHILTHNKHQSNENEQEKPKILVVEDNTDMADFISSILHQEYNVFTSGNGRAGLEIAKNHNFELIISDVMMPEMDGFEFCRHIKSNFATSHIPVILLTAKSQEISELEGYQTGADDYMTKPFNPKMLSLKIGNILQHRDALQKKLGREFQFSPKEIELTSPDEEMLRNLLKLMEENISNSNFNVNAMCVSVNLSHMHFIRKIKQLTGKRPVELLRSFRMKRAKNLLTQKKMTIAEVAYSVGFEVPSSFSRAFKKEFRESPTTFLDRMD